MCRSKRSARMTPPSYTIAGGLATAVESTPLPLGDADDCPPSYRETINSRPVDEKHSGMNLITGTMSSSVCSEKNCPSKLPMAYSADAGKSRTRTCKGCPGQASVTLSTQQIISASHLLLNNALGGEVMQKPTTKEEAKRNIETLKNVLRELKRLRRSCHLSCQDKRALKRELKPMEDDVRGVLSDLKREKCRMC